MNISRWDSIHVRRFGSATGLIVGNHIWSNDELWGIARTLAGSLIELGVRPGDRVALMLPQCMELYVACSAVWFAGGVVVVLGETNESERSSLIEHCDARVVIDSEVDSESAHRVVASTIDGTARIMWSELLEYQGPGLDRPVPRGPGDIAQLCYTSGTTGRPKAVIYTHGGSDAYLRNRASALAGSEGVVTLLALPSTAFGARLIAARLAGNVTYVLQDSFAPEKVLATIESRQVTELPLLPTLAEQLVAWRPARDYDTSSLRFVNVGGARVSAVLAEALRQRFGPGPVPGSDSRTDLKVTTVYGMTEAGGGLASTVSKGDSVVGALAPGVQARTVDEHGNALGPHENGEILVRSPYAAVGYWKDESATREVFQDGYVRTGDLGHFNQSGELCVIGRVNDLIIQGGQNIYPHEVEDVLREMQGVTDCAVIGIPDDFLGEAVVACVVVHTDEQNLRYRMQQHLQTRLNPRKRPAFLLEVMSLPRNSAGKADITALRRLAIEQLSASPDDCLVAELHSMDEATRHDALELMIERLANEALRNSGICSTEAESVIDIPFGERGMSSLTIVALARAVGSNLGRSVSPVLMFTYPTVRQLTEYLAADWRKCS